MNNSDLIRAYKSAVDEIIDQKTKMSETTIINGQISNPLFNDMFQNDDVLKADYGQFVWFSRCCVLTTTYLLAEQNIKDINKNTSYEERATLLKEVEKMRNEASAIFNFMKEHDLYFSNPDMKHFCIFFDNLYNGKPYDVQNFIDMLENNLQEARNMFNEKSNVKFTDDRLASTSFKFASTNELIEMCQLAFDSKKDISLEFKNRIGNLKRLSDDIKQKHAVETMRTDKGFITNYAFALWKDNVRDKTANAIERRILSTPGIYNKITQEFNHFGAGDKRIGVCQQQRVYGEDRDFEDLRDISRGYYEAFKGAKKIQGNALMLMNFCRDIYDTNKTNKNMKDLMDTIRSASKNKMPQTCLGLNKTLEMKDIPLRKLLLDARLESGCISGEEIVEREALTIAANIIMDTTKDCVEKIIENDFQLKDIIGALSEHIQEALVERFDKEMYEDLISQNICDYERGVATLQLITHIMNHGEEERQNNINDYNEAIEFLNKKYGLNIGLEKEYEELGLEL